MSEIRPATVTAQDAKILSTARAEFLRGQVSSVVRSYEALLRVYPNHGPVLAELSQIYLKFGRLREAEPLLERLLKVPTPNVNDLVVAARGFRKIGRNQQAIQALQALLKSPLSSEQAFSVTVELAELAERINDLELAENAVISLLDRNPLSFQSQFLAGKVAFRCGRLESALGHLKDVGGYSELTAEQQSQVNYTTGKVLDRIGRFEEADSHFVAAKLGEFPQATSERLKAVWLADLMTRVTEELRVRDRPAEFDDTAPRRAKFGRPLCFLTGHPRSGTTLLEQMLAAHPGVASADENSAMFHCLVSSLVFPAPSARNEIVPSALPELALRDLQVAQGKQPKIDAAIAKYREQLEWLASNENTKHYLIDKSPAGLIDLPMIEAILPDTRIVVMLRDPRDICLSCFQEDFGVNPVSVNFDSLESTAEKLVRDLKFWFAFRGSTRLPWLEVHYERLVANPEPELRRICQFLGLEWSPTMLTFQNTLGQRSIHSPSYSQVVDPISKRSIGRWKNYRSQFAEAERILLSLVQRLGYEGPEI